MINLNELEIWEQRWQALDVTMTALAAQFDNSTKLPRSETLAALVRRLQVFARGQFYFFYAGFRNHIKDLQNSKFRSVLELSVEYPPEYVLRVIIDQIALDLEVIQRAAHQRRSISASSTAGKQQKRLIATLKNADILVQNTLEPAIKTGLLPQGTTALTYYQKSPSIRVLPYAPVALVAIPYTCPDVPRDYLAIPHEAGHFLYRHGHVYDSLSKERQSIAAYLDRELLADSPEWTRQWQEEIFADVFGCLTGGPVIALDFQDLQLEQSQENFIKTDGDHPMPALRSGIYVRVLRNMGYAKFANSLKWLSTRWSSQLAARRIPFIFQPVSSVKEPRYAVDEAVDKIYDMLQKIQPAQTWSQFSAGGEDLAAGEDIGQLYEKFDNRHIELLTSGVEIGEFKYGEFDWETWVKESFKLKDPLESPEPIPAGDPRKKPDDGAWPWIHILDANGWTIKGPQSRGG